MGRSRRQERAKTHFLAGQSYYDGAAYADALKEFSEAYRISKRPALLYNIARCYEGMDQLDKAIDNLQLYLQQSPGADDREAVQTRIKNLQERLQASSRLPIHPPRPTQPTQNEEPRPPVPQAAPQPAQLAPAATAQRHRVWTWVVGGVGLGVLAAALGTGIASQLSYSDLNGKCMGNACAPGLAGEASSGRQLALATDVLWPIGAAAMVTAIVLFVVEGRRAATHARLVPSSLPGGTFALTF